MYIEKWVYVHNKTKQDVDPFDPPPPTLSISLMLAQTLDLHIGKVKYIQILLEHSLDTCGCYDTEYYILDFIWIFFTIFLINMLQKSK